MTQKFDANKGTYEQQLTCVSLYSGAGGLDYGFEAAGFKTAVAVEFDRNACATLRANREWAVLEQDIHETPSAQILETASLCPGDVDVLIGGPPCQPFSKAGYWARGDSLRLNDPRAGTLHEYMRCVKDLRPRVFLLENVHGISYSGKEEGFRLLERLTREINKETGSAYRLSWRVLNSAAYGVPQVRTRFFLVAHREGREFIFPCPTHVDVESAWVGESSELMRYATAWDAIGEFRPGADERLGVSGRWADLLPSIPEGENYLWHTDRKGGLPLFGWRTRYWSFLLKLAKNRPSWTIQAQPGPAIGPFHWESRRLSIEEMARLQTFPTNLRYAGSRLAVQRQLGNAVPSLLAEVLARAIAEQFFDKSYSKSPATLAVRFARKTPPPEPPQSVVEKYLHAVGTHAPHPGEGKGARAKGQEQQQLSLWTLLTDTDSAKRSLSAAR